MRGTSADRRFLALVIWCVLALFGIPGAALALDGPVGWQHMCARTPDLCNTQPAAVAPRVNAGDLAFLNNVNELVNGAIRPKREPVGVDIWNLAPRSGDCDDYAVTKKWNLLQAGWRGDRLRFATVLTESLELHVVLMVDAAQGRLVLDNRFPRVMTLDDLEAKGYKLLAVEGEGPRGTWKATRYAGVAALLLAAAATN